MIQSELLPHIDGYIAGKWTGQSGSIAVTNPANGDHLADIPAMGREDTMRAIESAQAALKHPTTPAQRRDWLLRLVQVLADNRAEIGRILTMEHGKPLAEAQGEVDYAAGFFRFAAENLHCLEPRTLEEQPRNCRWTVYHRPAGVVGLITPWNFPIGMIAKKLAGALAADCASVIKPSSKTPLTMLALFTLIDRELDLPPGKVNLVLGAPGPITETLFEHPAVRLVSFTGSTEVGRQLMELAAPGIKRTALELGGNAPFIVLDDADLDRAADNLMANKFRGGGQTCVCANRVFVQRSVADAFARKLTERVEKLRVGDGLEEGVDIGPLIDENAVKKVRRHVEDAVSKGARQVTSVTVDGLPGTFHAPTVLSGVTAEAACATEETFGPLVPLMAFDTDDEVIERANDTEFGLASYVFSADTERGMRVIERLQFGHSALNSGTGPTPEAPFGGMKQSGFGREGGLEGLIEFTEVQTVPVG